jgi:hypothetical protein
MPMEAKTPEAETNKRIYNHASDAVGINWSNTAWPFAEVIYQRNLVNDQ